MEIKKFFIITGALICIGGVSFLNILGFCRKNLGWGIPVLPPFQLVDNSYVKLRGSSWEIGSSSDRIAKAWLSAVDVTGSVVLGDASSDYHAINTSLNFTRMVNAKFDLSTDGVEGYGYYNNLTFSGDVPGGTTGGLRGIYNYLNSTGSMYGGSNSFIMRGFQSFVTSSATIDDGGIYEATAYDATVNFQGNIINGGVILKGAQLCVGLNLPTSNTTKYGIRTDVSGTSEYNYGGYFVAYGGTNNYDVVLGGSHNLYASGGDMTITASGGDILFGDENLTTTGTITGGTLTDGTLSITGGNLTTTGTISTTQIDYSDHTTGVADTLVFRGQSNNNNWEDVKIQFNNSWLTINSSTGISLISWDMSFKLKDNKTITFGSGNDYAIGVNSGASDDLQFVTGTSLGSNVWLSVDNSGTIADFQDTNITTTGDLTVGETTITGDASGYTLKLTQGADGDHGIHLFDAAGNDELKIYMNNDDAYISADNRMFFTAWGSRLDLYAPYGDFTMRAGDDITCDIGGNTTSQFFAVRDNNQNNLFMVDGTGASTWYGNADFQSYNITTTGKGSFGNNYTATLGDDSNSRAGYFTDGSGNDVYLADGSYSVYTYGDIYGSSDLGIAGKITSYGGYDPPYILLDKLTKDQLLDRIKFEVPIDKYGGLALWWNGNKLFGLTSQDGQNLDVYEIQMNKIATYQLPDKFNVSYETEYYFDTMTGEVKQTQKAKAEKYKIKNGIRFDRKTGKFYDKEGQEVLKEEAIELIK